MTTPGIFIDESSVGTIAPILLSQTVIGIVGTSTGVNAPDVGEIIRILSSEESEAVGDAGTLIEAVKDIQSHVDTPIIAIRYDDTVTDVEYEDEVTSKMNLFKSAEAAVGYSPTLLAANLDDRGYFPAGGVYPTGANPLVSKLEEVAQELSALAISGGPPGSVDAGLIWGSNNGGPRTISVFPRVFRPNTLISVDPSPMVAGAIARMDRQFGYWNNPSLEPVERVGMLDPSISFRLNKPNSDGVRIATAGMMALVRQQGVRTFGSRLNTDDASLYRFINVRRITDDLEGYLYSVVGLAIRRNISATFFDFVNASVNSKISDLILRGAVLSGSCQADRERNTVEVLGNGIAYFKIIFTPSIPAQQINFSVVVSTAGLSLL